MECGIAEAQELWDSFLGELLPKRIEDDMERAYAVIQRVTSGEERIMKFRQERGSEIVEMTLVFPIIIVLIWTMIFFGLMMYEQVAAQSVLDDVVSRAAANWSTADEGIYSESADFSGFTVWDVYSRLIDTKDGKKKENIESTALERLNKIVIISKKFSASDIHLGSTNIVVYKSLKLTVDREFPLPFAGFLRGLGIRDSFQYRRTGTAVIQDAPEFIRTIDMATDLLRRNSAIKNTFDNMQGKLGELTNWFKNLDLSKRQQ